MHIVHFYENEVAFISHNLSGHARLFLTQFFTKYSSAQPTKKYFFMYFGTRLITFLQFNNHINENFTH